jgi:hypothetical protein
VFEVGEVGEREGEGVEEDVEEAGGWFADVTVEEGEDHFAF